MSLEARRILIVEDEFLIARHMADGLQDAGAIVIGPAASVRTALASLAAHETVHAAILDVNLGGKKAYPVADALIARSVPFVFASGYSEAGDLSTRYPRVEICHKPLSLHTMLKCIMRLT